MIAFPQRGVLRLFRLVVLLQPLASYGQLVVSPRQVISLDDAGWKLVGLDKGEGENSGIPLSQPSKVEAIPTTVPGDVQVAIGLKDLLGERPEIWKIKKHEWWFVRFFLHPGFGQHSGPVGF